MSKEFWRGRKIPTGSGSELNADLLDGHDASYFEPADSTILKAADVDDAPVNGVTTAPISSNWAYDHAASATAHAAPASQAEMEAGTETAVRALSPVRIAQAIAALAQDNYAKYLVALNFGAEL